MLLPYINIHTHHPLGQHVELVVYGIHPWCAQKALIAPFVDAGYDYQAVGEIGLDYVYAARTDAPNKDITAQLIVFRRELERAILLDLPVVIHCVKAFESVIRELQEYRPRVVIFHGFIGSSQQAFQAVERGYYLSFGERSFLSPKTVEAMRHMPLNRLFFETDESTTSIVQIYARGSEILGFSVEELLRVTNQNYERIFKHG